MARTRTRQEENDVCVIYQPLTRGWGGSVKSDLDFVSSKVFARHRDHDELRGELPPDEQSNLFTGHRSQCPREISESGKLFSRTNPAELQARSVRELGRKRTDVSGAATNRANRQIRRINDIPPKFLTVLPRLGGRHCHRLRFPSFQEG
ncbi:hypothetical protein KM043_000386 [Ampulex compressa]|nr:hypothetical protein KM043_000386 [Ampulex compressa]